MKDYRANHIIKAAWVGIIGNFLLAAGKITLGFIAHSLAVIGDGIDTTSDIATYLIILFTASIIVKPPDKKYPYGYRRAETIATKLLSFVIFFVGAQLCIATIRDLASGEQGQMPSVLAIYVTLFSVAGKAGLAYWQHQTGKKHQSSMLLANAKNMRNDIVLSMAVLTGLLFTFYFQMPEIDVIVALAVSVWIMKVGVEIFLETSEELMDGNSDPEIYQKVFKAVEKVYGAYNPHRTRIRKVSNLFVIDLDIEVDAQMSVAEAHKIVESVENTIKNEVDNVYDIIVHLEPLGNIEKNEKYGVSRSTIDNTSEKHAEE